MKQYYVIRNNEQLGPFADAYIKEKVAAGELSANDMCWGEGMADWQALRAIIDMPKQATPPPTLGTTPAGTQLVWKTAVSNWFNNIPKKHRQVAMWVGFGVLLVVAAVASGGRALVIPVLVLIYEGIKWLIKKMKR